MKRPDLSDEHARLQWWLQELQRYNTLPELQANAAQMLTLRDAEIARFRRAQETRQRAINVDKLACPICGGGVKWACSADTGSAGTAGSCALRGFRLK